jgi:hypothetical protein
MWKTPGITRGNQLKSGLSNWKKGWVFHYCGNVAVFRLFLEQQGIELNGKAEGWLGHEAPEAK